MKWEYITYSIFGGTYSLMVPFDHTTAKPLNELGRNGWELVTIVKYGTSEDLLGYFKRLVKETG